jgi:hypothetical protein
MCEASQGGIITLEDGAMSIHWLLACLSQCWGQMLGYVI